jgi:hypothetical protein
MKTLELICGDPQAAEDGASFSRFIIPFVYRLRAKPEKEKSQASEGPVPTTESRYCYSADSAQADRSFRLQERREYFTKEMENALFNRAKWFRLRPMSEGKTGSSAQDGSQLFPKDIAIRVNNRGIAVHMSAPALVLFEFGEEDRSNKVEESWDILRTAFLVVELFFKAGQRTTPTLDDLLKINEVFRYFESPFEDHYKDRELDKFCDQGAFALSHADEQSEKSPGSFYHRWWRLIDNVPIVLGDGHQWRIERGRSEEDTKRRARNAYPDNRAFVWTCAILPEGAKHLWQTLSPRYWIASNYSHWIKLLNVDYPFTKISGHNYRSNEFERDWAEQRTYHRWEDSATYYGFTPHSGAVLAPQMRNPPISRHFGDMYFDQALLLLYLRVELFRFSAKLSEISRDARKPNGAEGTWANEFQKLRWQFTLFTNLYQFPLLSNQQQGVELYSLARRSMEIDALFEEVKEQIHNSHDYLAQQLDLDQTRETTRLTGEITFLTKIAVTVSVIAVTSALFAVNWFVESPFLQSCARSLGRFKTFGVFLIVFSAVAFLLYRLKHGFRSSVNH